VSNEKRSSATSVGRFAGSASARMRTHFNVQHMVAAAYFARSTLEIEPNHAADLVDGEPYFAHRAYVTGAVLSAVASLEATINELFIDAQNPGSPTFEGADPRIPGLLAEESWEEIEGKSTLCKYQKALTLVKKQEFDRGAPAYQDADALIQLRNALVHYKPEWNTEQKKHRKIEDRLKGRFAPNPFTGPNDVFFPNKCLGYGCAEWAVNSGVTFIESLLGQLGLPSIFRNYPRELLRTR
jgi:hypothetical protein